MGADTTGGYSGHPMAEDIERLGRTLFEAFDHAYPGDRMETWDQISPIEKDAFMYAILEVIAFAPASVLKMLAYNSTVDRSA